MSNTFVPHLEEEAPVVMTVDGSWVLLTLLADPTRCWTRTEIEEVLWNQQLDLSVENSRKKTHRGLKWAVEGGLVVHNGRYYRLDPNSEQLKLILVSIYDQAFRILEVQHRDGEVKVRPADAGNFGVVFLWRTDGRTVGGVDSTRRPLPPEVSQIRRLIRQAIERDPKSIETVLASVLKEFGKTTHRDQLRAVFCVSQSLRNEVFAFTKRRGIAHGRTMAGRP
jgi:hypothetical protein